MSGSGAPRRGDFDPRAFWEGRLASHPDLRGTGEPGLSLGYNRACYRLRERALAGALARERVRLEGARVLDVGSGVGFFVDWYRRRGARVTGAELTEVATRGLRERFPDVRFLHGDVSEIPLEGPYDVVNAFDVLYHIVDDAAWERALGNLARALVPGGVLALTDVFAPIGGGCAAHNVMRDRERYGRTLEVHGLEVRSLTPTHWLLNRDLGPWKGLNRLPSMLHGIDRLLLGLGIPPPEPANRLLVARREGGRGEG